MFQKSIYKRNSLKSFSFLKKSKKKMSVKMKKRKEKGSWRKFKPKPMQWAKTAPAWLEFFNLGRRTIFFQRNLIPSSYKNWIVNVLCNVESKKERKMTWCSSISEASFGWRKIGFSFSESPSLIRTCFYHLLVLFSFRKKKNKNYWSWSWSDLSIKWSRFWIPSEKMK